MGLLTPESADAREDRDVLARALGRALEIHIDTLLWPANASARLGLADGRPLRLEPGDRILVCSDGALAAGVTEEELLEALVTVEPDTAVQRLVARANALGGPDNVTVQVAAIAGEPAPMKAVSVATGDGVERRRASGSSKNRSATWLLAGATVLAIAGAAAAAIALGGGDPGAGDAHDPFAANAADVGAAPTDVHSASVSPAVSDSGPAALPSRSGQGTLVGTILASRGDRLRVRQRAAADDLPPVDRLSRGQRVVVREAGEQRKLDGLVSRWYRVEVVTTGKVGWVWGGLLEKAAPRPGKRPASPMTDQPAPGEGGIDSTTLTELLEQAGFNPPPTFKLFVMEIRPNASGGFDYHSYDHRGTSREYRGWWPASTVKIYPAIAALESLRKRKLSPKTRVTFEFEDKTKTARVDRLIKRALTPSDNWAFDRLVDIVGPKHLNTGFFTPRNGFTNTMLLRSYRSINFNPETEEGTNRKPPRMVLRDGARREVVRHPLDHRGYGRELCRGIIQKANTPRERPFEGNCTPLRDLAETMRRVMMHEHLPPEQRFDLGAGDLELLRAALSGKRKRGMNVVDGLKAGFRGEVVKTWSKPGYAQDWFSDNVFLEVPGRNVRYVVAMANFPGRASLDEAAGYVGRLLADDALKKRRLRGRTAAP